MEPDSDAAIDLNLEEVRAGIASFWQLNWRASVSSTQSAIDDIGRRPFTVLGAEYQSQGRGRLDRSFEIPAGLGLTFTIALSPSDQAQAALPLVAGLAVAKALSQLGVHAKVKWPNDLLISGGENFGKAVGILAERDGRGVKLGIGINVLQQLDQLAVPTATSISLCGFDLPREQVLIAVLNSFAAEYLSWQQGKDWRNEYQSYSATIGSQVKAMLPGGGEVTGLATGVSELGELVLNHRDLISVGDVVHLRIK
jgi:BirA family biotin operon repressor/biotin-[acetyl-CoA-carboxylase] ligase